ncbi:MAG: phage baseplate assembly protein V [Rhizomicrobium sp.]
MRLTVPAAVAALIAAAPAQAADFALHRATVESSADPQRAFRLLVRIPDLDGLTEWASASVPFTADPRATASPPPGATVWVLFEGGDTARPVWIGWSPDGAAPSRFTPFGRRRP